MAATKLTGSYKKERREYDGFSDENVRELFLETPLAMHVGVVLVGSVKKEEDFRDGTVRPQVQIFHSELIVDDDDVKAVKEILYRRYKERTGREAPEDLFTSAEYTPADAVD